MSMHALLLAVRNTLRAASPGGLAYAAKDCDLTPPDGQPPPSCGVYYIGVHEINVSPGTQSPYSLFDEIYSVGVTVTIKLRGTPWDRMVQKELYGATTSLDRRCRAIAAHINKDTIDHRIITAANALSELEVPLTGYAKQGFFEPLRFAGYDVAKMRGGMWFHANPDDDEPGYGWSKTIRFTGARRCQEPEFAN